MIEIYRRREGKDRLIRTFKTLDDLFGTRAVGEHVIAEAFSCNPEDRTDRYLFGEADLDNEFLSHHCYVCYESDKIVAPDRLVGLYRAWRDGRRRDSRYRYHWTRTAYGHWRAPKTTNELRWAHAWDDDENAPKTGFARGRRRFNALPTLWDDRMTHNDKSWKTQTKVRKQWQKKGV